MLTLPVIEERAEQAYAFVPFTVPMNQMKVPADEGFPKLFGVLGRQGIAPVGAPFYNYRRIDMTTTLDVESGVPVERMGESMDGVQFATLPAGRYVTITHKGHFDELMPVTAMLIGYCKEMSLRLDVREEADGDHFACRLEIYETDPDEVPDPKDWVTTLAFKLA